jgi:lipid-A-disaccharide synthase
MARRVSRVLAVLPFERALYEGARVPVSFVGHPLLDVLPMELGRDAARRALGVRPGERLLALLPGSRREEVARLLPAMADAAAQLHASGAIDRAALALAPGVDRRAVAAAGPRVEVVEGRTYEVMAAADAALVCSGTATLEAALLGAPMVVCYRVSLLTAVLARLLIRTRWASLPNNILGRAVVPELLQYAATGSRLAAEAERLLGDPAAAVTQRGAFAEIKKLLGEPGVADRAAREVLAAAGTAR